MLFHAALVIEPKHSLAANEAGVALARLGRLNEAKLALQHSASLTAHPSTWKNLASVHKSLGEGDLAQLAERESLSAKERWAAQTQATGQLAHGTVQVVDNATFAQAAPVNTFDNRGNQPIANAPPVGVPAQQLPPTQTQPTLADPQVRAAPRQPWGQANPAARTASPQPYGHHHLPLNRRGFQPQRQTPRASCSWYELRHSELSACPRNSSTRHGCIWRYASGFSMRFCGLVSRVPSRRRRQRNPRPRNQRRKRRLPQASGLSRDTSIPRSNQCNMARGQWESSKRPMQNAPHNIGTPANPAPICSVDCVNGNCGCASGNCAHQQKWHNASGMTWRDMRPSPFQAYGQGEYVGHQRLAHVPEYRLRVDDQIAFLFRLTREETDKPYLINVGDEFQVESFTDANLNRNLLVQPDGTVTLRLLGQVKATKLTVAKLRDKIEELYTKYYKVPAITLTPVRVNTKLEDLRNVVDNRNGVVGGQTVLLKVNPEGTIALPGHRLHDGPRADARRAEARDQPEIQRDDSGHRSDADLANTRPAVCLRARRGQNAWAVRARRTNNGDASDRHGRQLERRGETCGRL
jgi:hypothetical protein